MVEKMIFFIECSPKGMTSCFTEQQMFRLSGTPLQHIYLLISLAGPWCWRRLLDGILSSSPSIKSCLFSLAERLTAPSGCPHVIFRGDRKRFRFRGEEKSRGMFQQELGFHEQRNSAAARLNVSQRFLISGSILFFF